MLLDQFAHRAAGRTRAVLPPGRFATTTAVARSRLSRTYHTGDPLRRVAHELGRLLADRDHG